MVTLPPALRATLLPLMSVVPPHRVMFLHAVIVTGLPLTVAPQPDVLCTVTLPLAPVAVRVVLLPLTTPVVGTRMLHVLLTPTVPDDVALLMVSGVPMLWTHIPKAPFWAAVAVRLLVRVVTKKIPPLDPTVVVPATAAATRSTLGAIRSGTQFPLPPRLVAPMRVAVHPPAHGKVVHRDSAAMAVAQPDRAQGHVAGSGFDRRNGR